MDGSSFFESPLDFLARTDCVQSQPRRLIRFCTTCRTYFLLLSPLSTHSAVPRDTIIKTDPGSARQSLSRIGAVSSKAPRNARRRSVLEARRLGVAFANTHHTLELRRHEVWYAAVYHSVGDALQKSLMLPTMLSMRQRSLNDLDREHRFIGTRCVSIVNRNSQHRRARHPEA